MHPTRDQIAARLAPGADAPAIDAAVPMGPDGIDATASGLLVSLTYASAEAHASRVSADVEALRSLAGFVCVGSWSPAVAPLSVHLRYVLAPDPIAPATYEAETNAREIAAQSAAVVTPRPIAPAPVPATPSRRR